MSVRHVDVIVPNVMVDKPNGGLTWVDVQYSNSHAD